MNRLRSGSDKKRRIYLLISVAVCTAVFIAALHQRTVAPGFIPVGQEFANLYTMIKLFIARIFKLPFWLEHGNIMQNQPFYLESAGRLKSVLLTGVSGAAIAVAGALYQFVFRNDLASPSMLGVTYGINLAVFILVFQYSAMAVYMPVRAYVYCYAATAVILGLVFLSGRFSSDKAGNGKVVLMLLSGCVFAQIASAIVSNGSTLLSQDDYFVYLSILANGWGIGSLPELLIFMLTLLIGFVPVLFMRSSMDSLSFADEEARSVGLRTQPLRFWSLISGSLLVTASVIACSNVGIMAILIPHMSRYIFGSRFKDILFSCMLFGAAFLIVCRMISDYFSFGHYSLVFTLSAIVGLISAPLIFVIMIRRGRKMPVE